MIQSAGDFFGGIETPAVSVHFKNNRARSITLGDFLRAAQKHQERRGNFAVQRDYDHVPFVDHLERLGNPGLRETANHSQDRQSSRWAASEIDGQAARPSPRERTSQSTFHSFGKRRGAE